MTGNMVNLDVVELVAESHGENFASREARLGKLIGARQLGCTLIVVPPGKRSCPFHSHRANEEMFLILEGTGSLRYGSSVVPVKKGDLIACPTGGPETAHQLVNDSAADLRYLAFSTKLEPEVCEYPDSDKVLAFDGYGERSAHASKLGIMVHRSSDVDYWDGES
ncbi:MAG TPA: cupin domain-containing protein [Casimicrobiaceae bacterium]|nr:cupin domain-containing protein [Casimicrobiaceae bacterium]